MTLFIIYGIISISTINNEEAKMKVVPVPIELYVEQIYSGEEYKGYIKISGITISYFLKLLIPISKLKSISPPKNLVEIKNLFQLEIKKENTHVNLENSEFIFMIKMIIPIVMNLYTRQGARDTEGLVGDIMEMLRNTFQISSTSLHVAGTCDLPIATYKMLSTPKLFGLSIII